MHKYNLKRNNETKLKKLLQTNVTGIQMPTFLSLSGRRLFETLKVPHELFIVQTAERDVVEVPGGGGADLPVVHQVWQTAVTSHILP